MCFRQDWCVSDKTGVFQTRLVCFRQDWCVSDKTGVFQTRLVCFRYFLERSHSARVTLAKACELVPEEVSYLHHSHATYVTHMSPLSLTCHLCLYFIKFTSYNVNTTEQACTLDFSV